MKILIFSLILCFAFTSCALAESEFVDAPEMDTTQYKYVVKDTPTVYDTESLKYSIEVCDINGTRCYLSRIWMADPGKQIKKATAEWHKHLADSEKLAKKISGAALVINGSGYVSPLFPEIPDNYPGTSADYFFTPLGSLTVTDGEVFRHLEGVPYYGLTLEADGLHMYVGVDPALVLAHQPIQTWSFYEGCPMIQDGVSIIDRTWDFATRRAIRTIIAKLDSHQYLIITATNKSCFSLVEATDFLLGEFSPEWAYDLDGGPSTALFRRKQDKKTLKLIYGAGQKVVDVMGFVELGH